VKDKTKSIAKHVIVGAVMKGVRTAAKIPVGLSKAGKVVQGVVVAQQIYSGTSGIFLETKRHAKMSGKLLACALALNYPFQTQSISLVGFSLGTQVIKSCLKTLH